MNKYIVSNENKNQKPGPIEYAVAWIIIGTSFFMIYGFVLKPNGYNVKYMKNLIMGKSNTSSEKTKNSSSMKKLPKMKKHLAETKDSSSDLNKKNKNKTKKHYKTKKIIKRKITFRKKKKTDEDLDEEND